MSFTTKCSILPHNWTICSAWKFGLIGDSDRVWGDLVAEHDGADWLEEFNEAFAVCAQRKIPEPSIKTFRPPRGSEIVRPSIFRVDSYDGHPHIVCVKFTLEPSPGKVGGRVFNMLRSLERNRKELIQRFVDRTEPTDPILSSNFDLKAIAVASELINDETVELGVFDHKILTQCFPDAAVVEQLSLIGKKWHESSKLLHSAIDEDDRTKVLCHFLEISGYIDQFAKIASLRYSNMVGKRPDSGISEERVEEKLNAIELMV